MGEDDAQKSAQASPRPTNDAIASQDQQARTKMEEIVAKTKSALDDHPDYEVFTTGVSLDGALTTVFAFFAAACYPKLGPISCYSFASPKVGTLCPFEWLSKSSKLKIVRICNYADPVILLPKGPLSIIPCDAVLAIHILSWRSPIADLSIRWVENSFRTAAKSSRADIPCQAGTTSILAHVP